MSLEEEREVALASAYKLLHRHNWRKLAPDKNRDQADGVAQDITARVFRNSA